MCDEVPYQSVSQCMSVCDGVPYQSVYEGGSAIEYYISQCMSVCDGILYQSVYEGGSVSDEVPYQSVSHSVSQSVYECM
jgi:hypothetical protein